MFGFTPSFNFDKINLFIFPSLRGASATLFLGQSKLLNRILDCFAPLAMTIFGITLLCVSLPAFAATSIPFTINLSENVTVTGSPRIAVDVGGVTRYATYASGSGTSALTFTYAMVAGDVDLDGVTVSSTIQLNGGTIKDASGNDASLTFTPPNTTNVKVNYPSLGMDFVADADGRYTLNGTPYNDLPAFLTATGGSFTRASIGTYFDSTGVLQTAASGVPRFDYDPVTHAAKGILIEEQRTNLVSNSTMQGTIAGSPGTLPNGWGWAQMPPGVSYQVVGTGVDNGMTYVDIRIYGTPTNTQQPLLQMLDINITNGLSYDSSVYLKNINNAGNVQINCTGRTAAYAQTGFGAVASLVPTSSLARLEKQFTPSDGVTTKILYWLQFTTTSGLAGDQTIRIAAPQFEQGAFATSYIPTTTAAVTRQADVLSIPTAGWINSAESTLYSEGEYGGLGNARGIASLGSSFASNFQPTKEGDLAFRVYLNGTQIFQDLAISAFSNNKFAFGLKSGQYAYVKNGGTVSTSANATVATNQNTMISDGGFYHTKKLKYYPLRITNTQLQLMTQ